MGSLQNRIAMVTGAGSGMGREHTLLLADRGATVVVQDINGEGARETAELISQAGGRAHIVICDVADRVALAVDYRMSRTALGRLISW
jgi:3-oxoacyl-[acyl-carrier protein] reductase